jgi:hypothetical protein
MNLKMEGVYLSETSGLTFTWLHGVTGQARQPLSRFLLHISVVNVKLIYYFTAPKFEAVNVPNTIDLTIGTVCRRTNGQMEEYH